MDYVMQDFSVIRLPNMPFTLEPGESETVEVDLPQHWKKVEGSFSVTSTEPMGVRTVDSYWDR